MVTFDLGQLEHWIGLYLWPFVRIGACLMAGPVFGASYVSPRFRLAVALAITLPVAPLLPPPPAVPLLSLEAVLITLEQLVIGAALGFALQLVFDALTLGGQLLANGMGLGFGFNIDPIRGASTPALGQLYVVLGTLVFLALNGHLALIGTLVDSFRTLPVGDAGFPAERWLAFANWGSELFTGALGVALPGITALLVINLTFGMMSRAAPSLNLFAVGLPVTLVLGLVVTLLGLPDLGRAFTQLLNEAFGFMHTVVR
jgi:flagellar biosynthetic protein FliR